MIETFDHKVYLICIIQYSFFYFTLLFTQSNFISDFRVKLTERCENSLIKKTYGFTRFLNTAYSKKFKFVKKEIFPQDIMRVKLSNRIFLPHRPKLLPIPY